MMLPDYPLLVKSACPITGAIGTMAWFSTVTLLRTETCLTQAGCRSLTIQDSTNEADTVPVGEHTHAAHMTDAAALYSPGDLPAVPSKPPFSGTTNGPWKTRFVACPLDLPPQCVKSSPATGVRHLPHRPLLAIGFHGIRRSRNGRLLDRMITSSPDRWIPPRSAPPWVVGGSTPWHRALCSTGSTTTCGSTSSCSNPSSA
jgi:hypothetical protein